MIGLSDVNATSAAVTETNGHSQNGDTNVQNGVNTTVANNAQIHLDKTNQDIVRLICQYLKVVGLE